MVDPAPPYCQLFVIFWWVHKNRFFGPKHCFKPFLVGQNFHICLRSGQMVLTPLPLTVSLTVKYPLFFTTPISAVDLQMYQLMQKHNCVS